MVLFLIYESKFTENLIIYFFKLITIIELIGFAIPKNQCQWDCRVRENITHLRRKAVATRAYLTC